MSVHFISGLSDVTVRSPVHGNGEARERRQARSRAHDGSLIVADKELTLRRFRLQFRYLTGEEKADLEDFFDLDAKGSLNEFTYRDHDSVDHTARFLSETLDFTETMDGRWNLGLNLEIS